MCLVGVVVRMYIYFLILLIPTPLVYALYCSSIPTFCSLKKKFFVLVPVFCCNNILCIKYIFLQYKHTYGELRAPHGSHMKAVHNVLYMKKHTQTYTSYPAMDISCMTSRSVV